jgi:hypothetical protein
MMSDGSTICLPPEGGIVEIPLNGLDLIGFQQTLAHLVTLGRQEGEDHPAADHQRVRGLDQIGDHRELVGDLGTTQHHDVRPLRVLGEPLQHLDLGLDQAAGRAGQPRATSYTLACLRWTTPKPSETKTSPGRRTCRPAPPLGVVLGLLAGLVPDVLQHRDLAVGEAGDDRWATPRPRRSASLTSVPSSSTSRLAAGASEYFGLTWPLGRPRWASTMILAPPRGAG